MAPVRSRVIRRVLGAFGLALLATVGLGGTARADTPPAGYTIVSTSFTAPPGVPTAGSATCPAGTMPQGGGAYVGGVSDADNTESSYPSGSSWNVVVNNATSATTNAVAVCADAQPGYVQVATAAVANNAGNQTSASKACPAGTRILGGGALANSTSTLINLNGTYPSGNGWTGVMNNGSSSSETFKVFAVCSQYSIAATGYSVVVGTVVDNPAGRQIGAFVNCPNGDSVLGGGISSAVPSTMININTTYTSGSGNGWSAWENNATASDNSITPYAICAHGVPSPGIPESPTATLLLLAGGMVAVGVGALTASRRGRPRSSPV